LLTNKENKLIWSSIPPSCSEEPFSGVAGGTGRRALGLLQGKCPGGEFERALKPKVSSPRDYFIIKILLILIVIPQMGLPKTGINDLQQK